MPNVFQQTDTLHSQNASCPQVAGLLYPEHQMLLKFGTLPVQGAYTHFLLQLLVSTLLMMVATSYLDPKIPQLIFGI